jgi:hypothetical protein
MAVLLECARCYQHYTVPKQALRRPTSCPWCGASSADSKAQVRKTAKRKQPSGDAEGSANAGSDSFQRAAGETPAPTNGDPASVPLIIETSDRRGRIDRAGINDLSGGALTNGKPAKSSPNGTNGAHGARPAIVNEPPFEDSDTLQHSGRISSHALPPVRRDERSTVPPANGPPPVKPPVDPLAGIYPISPVHRASERFHYERRLPALLWLAIGVGLGACVVLAVLSIWLNRSARDERNREPSRGAQERQEKLKSVRRTEHSTKKQARQPDAPMKANGNDRAANEERPLGPAPSRVALAQESRPPNERKASQARWKSDRPPPIDDPADDSPGIGLKVIEAVAARVNGPDAKPAPKLPAVKADDAAAVAALAAAKIGLHKDKDSGQVEQVDGSFRMTDSLLVHVAKLSGVVRLKLSLSNVSDAGLMHIAEMTSLKELILNETKVTDAGIAHLEKLTGLEKLDLEKTGATNQCLAQLKRLTQLKHLDLRGTKVTSDAIKELKSALPAAAIRGA